jgi:signal transduction histidine kinase
MLRLTIRRRLQLSFAAVALSALGVGLVSYLQYRRLEGDARAVNLAGSLRMRAYRLATLASHYASYRDLVSAEAVESELESYRATLLALRAGDERAGIKPPQSEAAARALEAGKELFDLFEERVRALVRAAENPAGSELALERQATVAMAASLADRMDRATAEIERASAGAVRAGRNLQLVLFAATAAVALLSFRDLRRTVLRSLPALEAGLDAVARGRLGAVVRLGDEDAEVLRLERAFNDMSRELERARATILAHEAELARRNDELLRADRMKSQFLATMSHELRTPLTSIIGFSDLLRRGIYGPLGRDQEERLDAILRNARHLLALIGDVLDLAKIEAGKMDVRPEPVAIGPLAAEVADALRPLADAKGITLEVAPAADLPVIETDPARVRQILYNLAANAVKFTERGGVRIRAGLRTDARGVRVSVEDTGIGIPASEQARLFRRFEQIDQSATRRHGGAGLGLHISQRIAALLGGRIEVESEPGRGSIFALLLPERAAAAGAAEPRRDPASDKEASHGPERAQADGPHRG